MTSYAIQWVRDTTFSFTRNSHLSSIDQQFVGDTSFTTLPGCLISSHPMTNRQWVKLHVMFCQAVLSYLMPWPTDSEWHWYFFLLLDTSLIISYPMTTSLWVTLFFFLLQGSLIIFHPITNSQWVTLHSWQPPQLTSHPIWTNRMWVTLLFLPFFPRLSHLSSHNQQGVSDTAFFFCLTVSSYLIPWPTECGEWHCISLLHSCLIIISF